MLPCKLCLYKSRAKEEPFVLKGLSNICPNYAVGPWKDITNPPPQNKKNRKNPPWFLLSNYDILLFS